MGADKRDLPTEAAGIPPDEIGERPPKPRDEKNSDQGKLQASYDAQSHERGTRRGDRMAVDRDDYIGLDEVTPGPTDNPTAESGATAPNEQ